MKKNSNYSILLTFCFSIGLLFCMSCNSEPELFDIKFTVINETDKLVRIDYDLISRDCEFLSNDCPRSEISDLARPEKEKALLVNDKVEADPDIQSLFGRFELYGDDELSTFDFWGTDKLTRTQVDGQYEYELIVDNNFFD